MVRVPIINKSTDRAQTEVTLKHQLHSKGWKVTGGAHSQTEYLKNKQLRNEFYVLKEHNVYFNNMAYLYCTFCINSSMWSILCFWHIKLNIQQQPSYYLYIVNNV